MLALLLSLCASTAPGQGPDPADVETARQALLDLQASGIGTGLADAATELPILDGFHPRAQAPLHEMPYLAERGYLLVAAGAYEMEAASFCLNAGAYQPGGGDGYSLAPLKGPGANMLRTILRRWVDHPEVSQTMVQGLAWAIDQRQVFGDLRPDLQDAARTLLTAEELGTWVEFARDPDALTGHAGKGLLEAMAASKQEAVQRRMQELAAEMTAMMAGPENPARLEEIGAEMERLTQQLATEVQNLQPALEELGRRMEALTAATSLAMEEIEARLAPAGDPPPPAGSRQIPLTRWSYDASGAFIRFIPTQGFSACLVQILVPGSLAIGRDAHGRVSSVDAARGLRLELAHRQLRRLHDGRGRHGPHESDQQPRMG